MLLQTQFRSILGSTLLTLLLLVTTAGCELVGPPQDAATRLRIGAQYDEPSIDGVTLGDDTTAVVQQLGRPDYQAYGDFAGVFWGYTYPHPDGEGELDSLVVTIHSETGVTAVRVSGAYSGTTRDGLGIRSTTDRIEQALGSPDQRIVEAFPDIGEHETWVYEFGRATVRIRTNPDMVTSISMGDQ